MAARDQTSKTVYESVPYGSWVTDGLEGLIYHMPVDSGVVSFVVDFPITQADVNVLSSSTLRAALLYGALHHPFQLRETRLSEDDVRRYFGLILHRPIEEVAAFLNPVNEASKSAIHHLAGALSDLPPEFG